MRIALPLLLIASLTACGQRDEAANATLNATVPESREVAVDPPANAETVAEPIDNQVAVADSTDGIPAALQGQWTGAKEKCGDPASVQALQVTPDELIFHESAGTITKVVRGEKGAVAIDADFTGEGESWTKRLEMRLADGGQRLSVTNDGQTIIRKRCPGGA